MSTRKLAKELGLLRQRSQSTSGSNKSLVSNQMFSYLIVIDFESTCWREKNNYSQEIIEFPAVLLNTSSGEVESEFHTYVQPQEHPTLSEFCTELTGITQMQVEAGIPLQICLSRFCRWLQNLQLERGVVFPSSMQKTCSSISPSQKLCTFLTWSDWDLGVCLQYECKRKQLYKPDVLSKWIDLRSTYRLFYNRKPKGLNGALQDLGIQYSGREHSGLDDARNTAHLAARMMRDGCVMKITRSLERTPSMVKPVLGKKREKSIMNEEGNTLTMKKLSSSKIFNESCQMKLCAENNAGNLDTKTNSRLIQESVQNLVSPKTLLNSTSTPSWGHSRGTVTSEVVANVSSSVLVNGLSPMSCLPYLPHQNHLSKIGLTVEPVEEEEHKNILLDSDVRCGPYNDVLLEDTGDINEAGGESGTEYMPNSDSGDVLGEPNFSNLKGCQATLTDNVSVENDSKISNFSTKKKTVNKLNKRGQHLVISESHSYLVSKTGIWTSKRNQHELGMAPQLSDKRNTPFPLSHKPFIPEKTSTPKISFANHKPVTMQNKKHKPILWSSFSIFTDPLTKAVASPAHPLSGSSLNTPKNIPCSLSANTLSLCTNHCSICVTIKGGQRTTSPLCTCGRRAKRQVVSNGGPNHGRGFYCCPVRHSGSGGRIQKGCDFFRWESLLNQRMAGASNAGSSFSLCQINSTLDCHPQQRSTVRKGSQHIRATAAHTQSNQSH